MYAMFLQQLIRWCGGANLLAALLLLAFWYLYVALMPYRQLSDSLSLLALHKHWTFVNVLGVCGASLAILGLPGIYLSQIEQVGKLGQISFFLTLTGSVLLLGPLLWDTILWPVLARHDASLLDFKSTLR